MFLKKYRKAGVSGKQNTPFWDASLTDQERIDWLLKEMTVEEKLGYLASSSPDLPRLGIPGVSVGGEAAHGVEGRNDQNGLGKPDVTTSFPQPIGMSASWDPELIRQAGEITGTEARVVWHRHEGHGLSRWAPTVDLERDPRWGRNEEGYGEDPVLTGKMAGAYIRGMQGDDPKYLRCAATLKHFYGNNTEVGRGWKNSSIDPRNKYELYLEPFARTFYYKMAPVDNNFAQIGIERNHSYEFRIINVRGPGHSTVAEAMAAPPSNKLLLDYEVTSVDLSSHHVIANGHYYLGVSNSRYITYITVCHRRRFTV